MSFFLFRNSLIVKLPTEFSLTVLIVKYIKIENLVFSLNTDL